MQRRLVSSQRKNQRAWPMVLLAFLIVASAWYIWVGEMAVRLSFDDFIGLPFSAVKDHLTHIPPENFYAGVLCQIVALVVATGAVPVRRSQSQLEHLVQGTILFVMLNVFVILGLAPVAAVWHRYIL